MKQPNMTSIGGVALPLLLAAMLAISGCGPAATGVQDEPETAGSSSDAAGSGADGAGPGADGAGSMPQGRGLHWTWSQEQLAFEGYPGADPDKYSSPEWGLLYDDEGIAYGPKSYFQGRERVEHAGLEITEGWLQSRWVRLRRSACCTEPLLGHFLEVCDLAWMDLTTQLEYLPPIRINVYSPETIDDYLAVSGADFAQSFVATGQTVIIQPIDILFRRTLAGHVAYAGIAEVLIDMQTHGSAPPWLKTGLASYLAQEGYEHLSFVAEFRPQRESVLITPAGVNAGLVPFAARESGRVARYNAFLMAWHLSEEHGFDRIVSLLAALEQGHTFADAVQKTYGVSEAALLAAIDPTVTGEPTTAVPPR
ncbi:hypothetical protein DRQ32_08440 [bacterium]|nr:MAG: hypothetical protein DRQ32_08440 [bacterium]